MADANAFAYGTQRKPAVVGLIVGPLLLGGSIYAIANRWGITAYGAGLEPDLARYLYLVLAALGLAILVLTVAALVAGTREITVSEGRISVPRNEFSRAMVEIDPAGVSDVSRQTQGGIQTVTIAHPGGTTRVRSSNFAHADDYLDFLDALERVLPGERS